MNHKKNKGFILIIIIVTLALVAAEMFILTAASTKLLFEADTDCLNAVRKNLLASANAWAVQNANNTDIYNHPVNLDLSRLNYKKTALDITLINSTDNAVSANITISCSLGRNKIRSSEKLTVTPSR